MIGIYGGPQKYVQGPGAITRLGELTERVSSRTLIVSDADVLPFVEKQLATAFEGRAHKVLPFRGEVTQSAIDALVGAGKAFGADLVVGIGGGKGLDAAKGVVLKLDTPFVAVPSIASNDSPTGRSIAVYDDNHTLIAIDSIAESPLIVVADTALIVNAPARFLRIGMGDAIAKKFEAERAQADGAENFFGGKALLISRVIADACYQTLRKYGVEAMKAAEARQPNEAFEAVVEANVLLSGLGWENGGLSFAHAVVRGLSKARGVEKTAHGDQVGYATLVHLAIEGRDDAFLQDVMDFNRSVGLPASLTDLDMDAPTDAEIAEIARLTTIGPKGGKIIVSATADEITAAIHRVEAMAAA